MDQEEVDVVKLQALERVINGPEDVLVAVQVVPHLGADEDILALDGGVLLEEVADTVTHLILVQVEPGTVQVTVACPQGTHDRIVGLALGALAGEGAEANTGDLDPVAQSEGLSVGHGGSIGGIEVVSREKKREKNS